ncbi:MAG: hypothetical protein JOY80_09545, partial [Candidatus Dormibacteraeota bacterium]|nr:hypothetical protein [Candidatus Dormibacteraeota bacterium]
MATPFPRRPDGGPPLVRSTVPAPTEREAELAEAVEVYHRTYTTVLRSSGETALRVLEPSHRAMGSSLHPLASSHEPDLGAFLYAVRRLPEAIYTAKTVLMGQSAEVFTQRGYGSVTRWAEASAPGRRRRWHDDGQGTLAVLIASASDVDDLIPTMVALQIEWNKLHAALAAGAVDEIESTAAGDLPAFVGGSEDDWLQLHEVWGRAFGQRLALIASRKMALQVQMLGGTQVGYARVTRRWWQQVTGVMRSESLLQRPLYFVSSNSHSIANLVTGLARRQEQRLVEWVSDQGPADLREELYRLRDGNNDSSASWANFLFYAARLHFRAASETDRARLRHDEREAGVLSVSSRTALDVAAQVIPLDRLSLANLDDRIGSVDADVLRQSNAVIVNIDYPLGLAAYNILREVAETAAELRGVYILGKAATLNADVGDVMISSVIHDEHSGSTYWLDNAFSVADIAPYLRFGSGLDNQRTVSVKGTFLQNRGYLDFYYREAFTVVDMAAGPYCAAVYELTETSRYPIGEPVNFSKLPI